MSVKSFGSSRRLLTVIVDTFLFCWQIAQKLRSYNRQAKKKYHKYYKLLTGMIFLEPEFLR